MKKIITNRDPFLEGNYTPVSKLIHRYENRALVLVNNICPRECAFCMRKREMIKPKYTISDKEIKAIKNYLIKNKEVKELIFSGGDPLSTPDVLQKCLKNLGNLLQIKIIRINTRLPITFPKAVNDKILKILKGVKNKPVYLLLHINHTDELTSGVVRAIKKLQTGVTMVLSQTVFLKNINDNVKSLQNLFENLVEIGVKPYYIFHCDPVVNAKQFEVDFKKEIKIYSELRKKLSGLAYPIFTIEAENSKGKIPVPTDFWNFDKKVFRDFTGKKFRIK
ncbi:MAG: KamA family radical SAM protein [Candidatus Magasanikbacteria bacterium]|nr:KamA family radical SAM protein [Candidatus Magasanikbacteria bacterium]